MSERSRNLLRRGVVFGLAGAIAAGETVFSAAKDVAQNAEQVASSAGDLASDLVGEAQKTRHAAAGGSQDQRTQRQQPAAPRRRSATAARRSTPTRTVADDATRADQETQAAAGETR
jgi:hypothetical protein